MTSQQEKLEKALLIQELTQSHSNFGESPKYLRPACTTMATSKRRPNN